MGYTTRTYRSPPTPPPRTPPASPPPRATSHSPTSPPRRVVTDFPTFSTGAQGLSVFGTGVEKANPMFGGNAFGAGKHLEFLISLHCARSWVWLMYPQESYQRICFLVSLARASKLPFVFHFLCGLGTPVGSALAQPGQYEISPSKFVPLDLVRLWCFGVGSGWEPSCATKRSGVHARYGPVIGGSRKGSVSWTGGVDLSG
jgi:hypothetical protein